MDDVKSKTICLALCLIVEQKASDYFLSVSDFLL